MDQAITQLVEWIQTASPAIWAVLVRQVYVDVLTNVMIMLMAVTCIILVTRYAKSLVATAKAKHEKRYTDPFEMDWDDHVAFITFAAVVIITGCILIAALLPPTVGRLLNPEFYAIRFIMYSLPGG